ncbi:TetR/AcrR family transcriptional regulator [Leifsonia poae]|uniref:TetR/AcrR family transcriptional regulator n=1 Tax=Leifsonia poae TaxID=110933 RepID=UPI003D674270
MDLVRDASEEPAAEAAASEPVRRRRGEVLEAALLDAAWDELVDAGYSAFTIDAVATRAGTSRPVVYRRWATKQELVLAAIRRSGVRDQRPVPDTGTLRGDVIALLVQANESRLAVAAVLSVRLGAYYEETGTAPADLRDVILGDRTSPTKIILDRAVARGEIDPAKLTPRITSLPFDLVRQEFMMTLRPIPVRDIEEIVDTIYLPLLR